MRCAETYRIASDQFDPWWNLALEEHLLDKVEPGQVIFYLWQNAHTVVIGRNQNPWSECRIKLLEEEGGRLARRLSGGGAVYHDRGNLNFTFIMDRDLYNPDRQFAMMTDAVRKLGIPACRSGRNDILVEGGRKFSGNAFYLRPRTALHHGTILVDTDLNQVQRYLSVSHRKLASKGVASVKSRVVNLSHLKPSLTVEEIKTALLEAFDREYARTSLPLAETIAADREQIEIIRQKYASEMWRFGDTPEFNFSCGRRFDWGEIEFCLNVQKARIHSATVFSDSLEPDLIAALGPCLKDAMFDEAAMVDRLQTLAAQRPHPILDDLIGYFHTHPLSS